MLTRRRDGVVPNKPTPAAPDTESCRPPSTVPLVKNENKPMREVGDRGVCAKRCILALRAASVTTWCGDFHGVADFSGAAAAPGLRRASRSSEGHGIGCRRRHRIQQRRRSRVVRSRFPWISTRSPFKGPGTG
ncbi:hypothetical protein NDU88_001192 [Pleurodeles waltl]|uniref:Uncharacterized protein n=1 Tax=Pleurodeles waltl TaxID=8319 RepID=A0AAV7V7J0_PLEWA|nr:hypothetical protein NDU88_001192 [Pleurodeles waltl]